MPKGKHDNHLRGSQHYRWSTGAIVSAHGYRKLRVGIGHELADPNGYAYEHLVVWVAGAMRAPGPDEILHHRNGDRLDNRIENLELMTRAAHNALHNVERKRDERGRFIGKKRAGRLLDGREWNDYQEVQP